MKRFLPYIAIALFGILVYANSVSGKFVWDDDYIVKYNGYIRPGGGVAGIITTDLGAGSGRSFNFYRPLQIFTYAVDYRFWELDERGYHITNIILHVLAAFCLYGLAAALCGPGAGTLFACLLFVACPLFTSAVAYVSGRADPLCAIFFLTGITLYIKWLDRPASITGTSAITACYILAMLSREIGLFMPVIILLYHISLRKKIPIIRMSVLILAAAAYIAWRKFILPHSIASFALAGGLERLPGFFVALASYAKLILAPVNLHMEYGNPVFKITDPAAIAGAALFLTLAAATAWAWKKDRLLFFGLAWFILMLLPFSNIYPLSAYMAEHWMYFPSMGLVILVGRAAGMARILNPVAQSLLTSFMVSAVFCYSLFTIGQNYYWKDPITLYKRTLEFSPNSPRALNYLGRQYDYAARYDDAIRLYNRAIEVDPSLPLPYNNLGLVYEKKGDYAAAEKLYKKALSLDPDYADALNNLGVIYQRAGKPLDAIELYKKAIAINPFMPGYHHNMSIAYDLLGRPNDAPSH